MEDFEKVASGNSGLEDSASSYHGQWHPYRSLVWLRSSFRFGLVGVRAQTKIECSSLFEDGGVRESQNPLQDSHPAVP